MWIQGSSIRTIDFQLVDIDDAPVPGVAQADLEIVFTRNGEVCDDPLTFTEIGEGSYRFTYEPSSYGQDVLDIYHEPTDLRFLNVEDIYDFQPSGSGPGGEGSVFGLDHDFGGTDHLRITAAAPESYRLLVYLSQDWIMKRREEAYAFGSSELDSTGRWKNKIWVIAGTYHIVISKFRTHSVAFPHLEVAADE